MFADKSYYNIESLRPTVLGVYCPSHYNTYFDIEFERFKLRRKPFEILLFIDNQHVFNFNWNLTINTKQCTPIGFDYTK